MTKLDKIKEQIRQQLDLCDAVDTPTICQMKTEADGYAALEKLIIDKVLYSDNLSIADAIVDIENTYNINSSDQ